MTRGIPVGMLAAFLIVVVVSCASATIQQHFGFRASLVYHGNQYYIGQEVRVELTQDYTPKEFHRPVYINASYLEAGVRIIAAYSGRTSTGTSMQVCNATSPDIWSEHTDLGVDTFVTKAHFTTAAAYATVIIPPFPFKICVRQYLTELNNGTYSASWQDPVTSNEILTGNMTGLHYRVNGDVTDGDFAAVQVEADSGAWDYPLMYPSSSSSTTGDAMKLVPEGYPCTYEKSDIGTYCSASAFSTSCETEGSVKGGVASVGSTLLNPLRDSITSAAKVGSGEQIVGFFSVAAGNYHICYSPKSYRTAAAMLSTKAPVWFKLLRKGLADEGCNSTSYSASCVASTARLTVASRDTNVRFSSVDRRALTYGTIKFTDSTGGGVKGLHSTPATSWEYSSPKNYFDLQGGDEMKIVPFSAFTDSTTFTQNNLYSTTYFQYTQSSVSSKFGASGEKFSFHWEGISSVGTTAPAGCWSSSGESYGASTLGGTVTSSGDTGYLGPTASADLGGNPRNTYSWNHDASYQENVWAHVRFPVAGSYVVCYRRMGESSYRRLQSVNGHEIMGVTELGRANFTYYMNDTTAGSWAALEVRDSLGTLTTMPSNWYSVAHPTPVVGSALRIVGSNSDCWTGEAFAESWDPGLKECNVIKCQYGICSNCEGSKQDSTTLRGSVFFYIDVPPRLSNDYYRICFKSADENWQVLPVDGFSYRDDQFNPAAPVDLDLIADDWRAFSLASITVRVGTSSKLVLDSRPHDIYGNGDWVRLVANSSQCDMSWSGTNQGPNAMPALSDGDLGVHCYYSHPAVVDSTSTCHADKTANLAPYYHLDATGNSDDVRATVAFLTLPYTPDVVYRLCYKPAHRNWFTIRNGITFTADNGDSLPVTTTYPTTYLGGNYTYFLMAAQGTHKLNLNDTAGDRLKLVSVATECSTPAAGTATYANSHASYSWDFQANSDTRDEVADEVLSATSGRAYMTLPTTTGWYRLCYWKAGGYNWMDIGSKFIAHHNITYAITSKPVMGGDVPISFHSAGEIQFDPSPTGDKVMFVPVNSPCADSTTPLSDIATDIGPGDFRGVKQSAATVHLDNQQQSTRFKVCYWLKVLGYWVEVEADKTNIWPALADSSGVSGFTSSLTELSGLSTVDHTTAFEVTGTNLGTTDYIKIQKLPRRCDHAALYGLEVTGSALGVSGGTIARPQLTMPDVPGDYIVCYRKASQQLWIKLSGFINISATPSVGVVETLSNFSMRLRDKSSTVAAGDTLELITTPKVCGYHSSSDVVTSASVAFCDATSCLTTSTTSYPFQFASSIVYQWCIKRTTDSRWYVVFNADVTSFAFGSSFFSTAALVTVKTVQQGIAYNATYPLDVGAPLRYHVSLLSGSGTLLPFMTASIKPVGVPLGSFLFETYSATCGLTTEVPTVLGTAEIDVYPTTTCPITGCVVQFEATTAGATVASTTTTFQLGSSTIHSIEVKGGARKWCNPTDQCYFDVRGLTSEGTIAYTATGTANMTFTSNTTGLSINCVSCSSGGNQVAFVNGLASFALNIQPTDLNAWTRYARTTVTFATGQTSISVTFDSERDTVEGFKIVDVYPARRSDNTSLSKTFIPRWEPATSTGLWEDATSLSAARGFYLHSWEWYCGQIKPINAYGKYMIEPVILQSPSHPVARVYIRTSATTETSTGTAQTVTKLEQEVCFATNVTSTCPTGGCEVVFSVTHGSNIFNATLTTPLRHVADRLVVSAASSATLSTGLVVTVEGQNFLGFRDEFNNGTVFAEMQTTRVNSSVNAVTLRSTSRTANMSNGVAVFNAFRTTKPCFGCKALFYSSWGSGLGSLQFTLTNTTNKLSCTITSPIRTSTGTALSVVPDAAELPATAYITKEATITVEVVGVDARGVATDYETNWVSSHLLSAGYNLAMEAGHTRSMPMANSRRLFSFRLVPTTGSSGARVGFVAQRFGSWNMYWANSMNGVCSLPLISITSTLVVHHFNVATAAAAVDNNWWMANTGSSVSFELTAADLYGTTVAGEGGSVSVSAMRDPKLPSGTEDGAFQAVTQEVVLTAGKGSFTLTASQSCLAVAITLTLGSVTTQLKLTVLPPAVKSSSHQLQFATAEPSFASAIKSSCDKRASVTVSDVVPTMSVYVVEKSTGAVDYLRSYNTTFSITNQQLTCGDLCHVMKGVLGTSTADIIRQTYNRRVAGGAYPRATFTGLQGKLLGVSGKGVFGAPDVSALSTSTAITFFSSTSTASQFAVLPTSKDDSCGSTPWRNITYSTASPSYVTYGNATGFTYVSGPIYAGVPFPLTVEFQSAAGDRVHGAVGSLRITKFISKSCTDGGAMSYWPPNPTLSDGQATVWITFARSCDHCAVAFDVVPTNTASLTLPATGRRVVTSTFTVSSIPRNKTVAAVSSPKRETPVLRAGELTTTSFYTLLPFGNFAFHRKDQLSFRIRAYNKIKAFGQSVVYGNGGYIGNGVTYNSAGIVTTTVNSGQATIKCMYQRPCESCSMVFQYSIEENTGVIALQHSAGESFKVITTATKSFVYGYYLRRVITDKPFAMTAWFVDDEWNVDRTHHGNMTTLPGRITLLPNGGNGDGGKLVHLNGNGGNVDSSVFHGTLTWLLKFTAPCAACRVKINDDEVTLMSNVPASHFRVQLLSDGANEVVLRNNVTFLVTARSRTGELDLGHGGVTDARFMNSPNDKGTVDNGLVFSASTAAVPQFTVGRGACDLPPPTTLRNGQATVTRRTLQLCSYMAMSATGYGLATAEPAVYSVSDFNASQMMYSFAPERVRVNVRNRVVAMWGAQSDAVVIPSHSDTVSVSTTCGDLSADTIQMSHGYAAVDVYTTSIGVCTLSFVSRGCTEKRPTNPFCVSTAELNVTRSPYISINMTSSKYAIRDEDNEFVAVFLDSTGEVDAFVVSTATVDVDCGVVSSSTGVINGVIRATWRSTALGACRITVTGPDSAFRAQFDVEVDDFTGFTVYQNISGVALSTSTPFQLNVSAQGSSGPFFGLELLNIHATPADHVVVSSNFSRVNQTTGWVLYTVYFLKPMQSKEVVFSMSSRAKDFKKKYSGVTVLALPESILVMNAPMHGVFGAVMNLRVAIADRPAYPQATPNFVTTSQTTVRLSAEPNPTGKPYLVPDPGTPLTQSVAAPVSWPVAYRGPDGVMELWARAEERDIQPSKTMITFQKPVWFAFNITGLSVLTTATSCVDLCPLPISVFRPNATGDLRIETNVIFALRATVVDKNGSPVKGDDFSLGELQIYSDANQQITDALVNSAGEIVSTLPFSVVGGLATVLGSVRNPVENAYFGLSCTNCDLTLQLEMGKTERFSVVAQSTAYRPPAIAFHTNLTSLDEFDLGNTTTALVDAFQMSGTSWITEEHIDGLIGCLMDPSFTGVLPTSSFGFTCKAAPASALLAHRRFENLQAQKVVVQFTLNITGNTTISAADVAAVSSNIVDSLRQYIVQAGTSGALASLLKIDPSNPFQVANPQPPAETPRPTSNYSTPVPTTFPPLLGAGQVGTSFVVVVISLLVVLVL